MVYLYGKYFDAQESLPGMFPNLMNTDKNFEFKFLECTSYTLCIIWSYMIKVLNSTFSIQSVFHFFAINYSTGYKQQGHVFDVIISIFTKLSLPALFSVNLYNSSLTPEGVIRAVENLKRFNISIEDYD